MKIALIVNDKTVFDFDFEHVLDQLFYASVIYRKQTMVPEAFQFPGKFKRTNAKLNIT